MKVYSIKSNARRAAKAAGLDVALVQPIKDGQGGKGFHIITDGIDLGYVTRHYNQMVAQLGETSRMKPVTSFEDADKAIAFCESAASALRAKQQSEAAVGAATTKPEVKESEMSVTTDIEPTEPKAVKTRKPRAKKAAAAAPKALKGKAEKKPHAKRTNGEHGGKTAEIGRLLARKNGVTAKEILESTGWPSVSVPAIAKNLGVKLRKEKEKGSPTRYYAG